MSNVPRPVLSFMHIAINNDEVPSTLYKKRCHIASYLYVSACVLCAV